MHIPASQGPTRAFSLIELIVVVTIILLLAALLIPVTVTMQREGRRATCAGQLRQFGMAVQNYANDNDGALVSGANSSYYWLQFLRPYLEGYNKSQDPVTLPKMAYCPDWFVSDPVGRKQGKSNLWDIGYSMNIMPIYDPSVPDTSKHNRWYGSGTVRDTSWTADYKMMDVTYKSTRALILDGEEWQTSNSAGFVSFDRHSAKSTDKNNPNNRANVLFFDYHVESCNPATIKLALNDPKQLQK